MKTTPRFWLATLLAILPLSAIAEWSEISSFDDGMRVFVNTGTVERIDEIAVVSHLVRWGEPQKSDEDAVYLSTIVRTRYDCANKLERYLGSVSYAGPMGNGDVVVSDETKPTSGDGRSPTVRWKKALVGGLPERVAATAQGNRTNAVRINSPVKGYRMHTSRIFRHPGVGRDPVGAPKAWIPGFRRNDEQVMCMR